MLIIDRTTRRFALLATLVSIWVIMGLCGCADYVPEKATELQARSILNNLSRIQPVADPNIPIPDVYKSPPKIIEQNVSGVIEYKLFYFCKYHTADKLQVIVRDQFASTLFGKKGQATTMKDYTITGNPATNQLIVRAPTVEDIQSVLELLEASDVPPIQVRVDCLISELYADLTMDKEVTLLIENIFGESIVMGGKVEKGQLLPAFPGAALRDPARDKFGLKVGFGAQVGIAGHEFSALIDLLVSRGYLKILMNPSLEIVNGQTARIETKEHVPLQQVFIRGTLEGFLETRTEYYDIIDSLQITPHVFADGYIGLQTDVKISAKLTPEGITQQPIVTERTISNKENRIRHGESLIIGGMRKSEKRDVIRGVPFLKDIPLIGALFTGRDFEERAKEVIFILTPTISTGGMPNTEMVDMIRDKHEPPIPYEELHRAILDPFGFDSRERDRQRQLLEAEEARIQAIAEKERARRQVREADRLVEEARSQADRAMTELTHIRSETARLKAEAELLAAQAAKAKAEAEKAKAEAEKNKATGQTAPPEGAPKPSPKPAGDGKPPAEGAPKASGDGKPAAKPQTNAAKPAGDAAAKPEDKKPEAEGVAKNTGKPAEDSAKPAAKPEDIKPAEAEVKVVAEDAAKPAENAVKVAASAEDTKADGDAVVKAVAQEAAKAGEDAGKAAAESENTTPDAEAAADAQVVVVPVDIAKPADNGVEPVVDSAKPADNGAETVVKSAEPVVKVAKRRFWYGWLGLPESFWSRRGPVIVRVGEGDSEVDVEAGEQKSRVAEPGLLEPTVRQFKGS